MLLLMTGASFFGVFFLQYDSSFGAQPNFAQPGVPLPEESEPQASSVNAEKKTAGSGKGPNTGPNTGTNTGPNSINDQSAAVNKRKASRFEVSGKPMHVYANRSVRDLNTNQVQLYGNVYIRRPGEL